MQGMKRKMKIVLILMLMMPVAAELQALNLFNPAGKSSSSASVEAAPSSTKADIEQRLAEIRAQLKTAEEQQDKKSAPLLQSLDVAYQRQLTALNRQESLLNERRLLHAQLEKGHLKLPDGQPPFTLSQYDLVLDDLSSRTQQEDAAQLAVRLEKKAREEARLRLGTAEQRLRLLKDQKEPDRSAIALAELELEQAQALFALEKILVPNVELELELAQMRTADTRTVAAWVARELAYSEDDLARHLQAISDQRDSLLERKDRLAAEQQIVEERWLKAQENVDEPGSAGTEVSAVRAKARLREREAWRETYQKVIEQTDEMLRLLAREEQLWQRRYELIQRRVEYATLTAWSEDVQTLIATLDKSIAIQQAYLNSFQPQLAALNREISVENLDPVARTHYEGALKALLRQAERNFEHFSVLRRSHSLAKRFRDEIGLETRRPSLGERFWRIGQRTGQIWQFELWVIDDHPVTVRKMVMAIVIFVAGILVTKGILKWINRRLLKAATMDKNSIAIIENTLYYFVLLVLLLFTLKTVNIPLTAFTFLGGALAIGAGFGAQNLLNNLISGFIMMLERPIRIGDIIEVEGKTGVIQEIGARCTRVLTFDNVDILVPNSQFLEQSIINWTRTDQVVRTKIEVGVAYGSDTEKVRELLLKVASEHGRVLAAPEPFVIFRSFGDSALIFELFIWLDLDTLVKTPSDLRFRIDEVFRENGISIAFPQTDVHLDIRDTLRVRLEN